MQPPPTPLLISNPIGPHRHVILAFIASRIVTGIVTGNDLLETDVVLDSSPYGF